MITTMANREKRPRDSITNEEVHTYLKTWCEKGGFAKQYELWQAELAKQYEPWFIEPTK
jgi:hypothetical protein